MALGEMGFAISQRLLLPRDLHLPWVVCGAWRSHVHLSGVRAAAARSVLPSLSGGGRVGDLPAKVLEAKQRFTGWHHGDGKVLGRGRPSSVPAPKQVSFKQAFRQCVPISFGVACASE